MLNSRSLACPRWVPWRDSQRLESVFDQWSVRGFRWFTRFIQYKLTSVSAALMGIIRFLLTVRTVAVAAARYIGLRNMSDRKSLLLIWRFLEFALFLPKCVSDFLLSVYDDPAPATAARAQSHFELKREWKALSGFGRANRRLKRERQE